MERTLAHVGLLVAGLFQQSGFSPILAGPDRTTPLRGGPDGFPHPRADGRRGLLPAHPPLAPPRRPGLPPVPGGRPHGAVHRRYGAPVLDYRRGHCGGVFNAFTGTCPRGNRRPMAQLVPILRGFAPPLHAGDQRTVGRPRQAEALDGRHPVARGEDPDQVARQVLVEDDPHGSRPWRGGETPRRRRIRRRGTCRGTRRAGSRRRGSPAASGPGRGCLGRRGCRPLRRGRTEPGMASW